MIERRKYPYHIQEWLWYIFLLPKQPLKIAGLRVKPQQRDHSFKDRWKGKTFVSELLNLSHPPKM